MFFYLLYLCFILLVSRNLTNIKRRDLLNESTTVSVLLLKNCLLYFVCCHLCKNVTDKIGKDIQINACIKIDIIDIKT